MDVVRIRNRVYMPQEFVAAASIAARITDECTDGWHVSKNVPANDAARTKDITNLRSRRVENR